MRQGWIRATGLGIVVLAAVVLAASPVRVEAAQTVRDGHRSSLRAFWDPQGQWFDQTVRKALRAGQQPGSWEVLVDLDRKGEWDHQGLLKEVYRRRPEPAITQDEALKNSIDSLGTVVVIGEVQSAKGGRLYVVAAVLEQDTSIPDPEGGSLKPFAALKVYEGYQDALQFAERYDATFGSGEAFDSERESPPSPGGTEKILNCEQRCTNQQAANHRYCDTTYSGCLSAADSFFLSCRIACLGNTACEAACALLWIIQRGSCVQSQQDCYQTAYFVYLNCIATCDDGGIGCSATATDTGTTALPLDRPVTSGEKFVSAPIDFALARSENRGEESFVMDEWAVVKDGQVRSSSNPAFSAAVTDQQVAKGQGSFLMIQEPIHAMNSRHVPKPEVKISSTGLARSERGAGEVVAARLEFSPAGIAERIDIVYTSRPMDKSRLEKLVSQRVGVVFASEKGHRTAVYVSFRLTDHLELLGTATAFPKCCCGGEFCV